VLPMKRIRKRRKRKNRRPSAAKNDDAGSIIKRSRRVVVAVVVVAARVIVTVTLHLLPAVVPTHRLPPPPPPPRPPLIRTTTVATKSNVVQRPPRLPSSVRPIIVAVLVTIHHRPKPHPLSVIVNDRTEPSVYAMRSVPKTGTVALVVVVDIPPRVIDLSRLANGALVKPPQAILERVEEVAVGVEVVHVLGDEVGPRSDTCTISLLVVHVLINKRLRERHFLVFHFATITIRYSYRSHSKSALEAARTRTSQTACSICEEGQHA